MELREIWLGLDRRRKEQLVVIRVSIACWLVTASSYLCPSTFLNCLSSWCDSNDHPHHVMYQALFVC